MPLDQPAGHHHGQPNNQRQRTTKQQVRVIKGKTSELRRALLTHRRDETDAPGAETVELSSCCVVWVNLVG